jgi:hypothetical protein
VLTLDPVPVEPRAVEALDELIAEEIKEELEELELLEVPTNMLMNTHTKMMEAMMSKKISGRDSLSVVAASGFSWKMLRASSVI